MNQRHHFCCNNIMPYRWGPLKPDQTWNNSPISIVQNTSSIAYFRQRTKSIATYTPGELNNQTWNGSGTYHIIPSPFSKARSSPRNHVSLEPGDLISVKLLKENELLNLRNTNQFELPNQTPQLRTVSSDFTWAFMRRIADGQSIQMMTDGRQYKAPLDGTRLPPIIPPKLSKMKIAPIRSFVDEISKQLLSICNEVLNLMVSRLFQGGSIYSDTFIEPGFHLNSSSSHWLVILSSDWLSVRKWNPF